MLYTRLITFLRQRELLHQEVFNVKELPSNAKQYYSSKAKSCLFINLFNISYLMVFWKKSFQGHREIMTNLACAADSPLGCHVGYQEESR